jgi:hypothetical protein
MNNKKYWFVLGLVLLVFSCFVAYKYIASGIQENKEKAVIQERNKTKQTESQKPTMKAVLPEVSVCSVQSEVNASKEWIHACYLSDLLTEQCRQVFDINGYYLTDKYNPISSPEGYIDTYEYLNNANICKCKLPSDVANRLNADFERSQAQCPSITLN